MIDAAFRKAEQFIADPVLRNWVFGRLLGRWPGEPSFTAHRPPCLDGLLPLDDETPSGDFIEIPDDPPTESIEISLAGATVKLEPGEETDLFSRRFDDLESTLALHRFAWLPLHGGGLDPAWPAAIWRAWLKNHAEPDDNWAWHPYTAAERAVNILAYARRNGLPGPLADSLSVLARHGPAIAGRLEYFGPHNTSNHLANNGRGLFLLGLALGLPRCAEMGGRILTDEAERIFHACGILREGSSHYHALLAANYGQCAAAAAEIDRPEAALLTAVARRARAVAGCLTLPGGFPLIGDISPDLPPQKVLDALDAPQNGDAEALAEAGWHRLDCGPWSGLWHASPEGFSAMPGHGHQDCGGFELHFGDQPVFVDPGRGAYGETGPAAFYRSGRVHNNLLIDGTDPYPANKPYYDEAFRRRVAGPPPRVVRDETSLCLSHNGFSRLRNVGEVSRKWLFGPSSMTLSDSARGRGVHRISRILVTPLAVAGTDDGLRLRGDRQAFRLTADGHVTTETITRWTAYGRGQPATAITISSRSGLPWSGELLLEAL